MFFSRPVLLGEERLEPGVRSRRPGGSERVPLLAGPGHGGERGERGEQWAPLVFALQEAKRSANLGAPRVFLVGFYYLEEKPRATPPF